MLGSTLLSSTYIAGPKGRLMDKKDIVWISQCPDIFGGYGILATGRTKAEAEKALWAEYKKSSPGWNKRDGISPPPLRKSFKELEEWWGVDTAKVIIGKSYFSPSDGCELLIEDQRKYKQED